MDGGHAVNAEVIAISPECMVGIESDGRTVWVSTVNGTIARFGEMGIDVHTSDTTGCLHCTHGPTTFDDWWTFVAKVAEHHNIDVGERHMPDRFKAAIQREEARQHLAVAAGLSVSTSGSLVSVRHATSLFARMIGHIE